jgi:Tol biopolymer transport system component
VLAYAVTQCIVSADGLVRGRSALEIRRGACEPVRVFDATAAEGIPDPFVALGGTCNLFARVRDGNVSVLAGAVERLGVSPDGTRVVFEITDDFSLLTTQLVPPDAEGIFVVDADGSAPRRLGPASRDPSYRVGLEPRFEVGIVLSLDSQFRFSPSGRRVVFTDRGPGPDGVEATQIAMFDLDTGERHVLTSLPPAIPPAGFLRETGYARFENEDNILFQSYASPDGTPARTLYRVRVDGSGLETVPPPVALPGSLVVPTFELSGTGGNLLEINVPGVAVNPLPQNSAVSELFLSSGKRLLQITSFGRRDTVGQFIGIDRRRVFFRASADPFGRNPTNNCQLFSVDTFGGHLRQITRFSEGVTASVGCGFGFPPGCILSNAVQDPVNGTVIFYSNCDPYGTNPFGGQVFAMRPNGSGLHQVTAAHGFVGADDGSSVTEMPGPFSYSGRGFGGSNR